MNSKINKCVNTQFIICKNEIQQEKLTSCKNKEIREKEHNK